MKKKYAIVQQFDRDGDMFWIACNVNIWFHLFGPCWMNEIIYSLTFASAQECVQSLERIKRQKSTNIIIGYVTLGD